MKFVKPCLVVGSWSQFQYAPDFVINSAARGKVLQQPADGLSLKNRIIQSYYYGSVTLLFAVLNFN